MSNRKYEISEHPNKLVIKSVEDGNAIKLVCWFPKDEIELAKSMCRILNQEHESSYSMGYEDCLRSHMTKELITS